LANLILRTKRIIVLSASVTNPPPGSSFPRYKAENGRRATLIKTGHICRHSSCGAVHPSLQPPLEPHAPLFLRPWKSTSPPLLARTLGLAYLCHKYEQTRTQCHGWMDLPCLNRTIPLHFHAPPLNCPLATHVTPFNQPPFYN